MGFLSNLFGDPPQPPNPIETAGAQTASNIGTAVTGSYLNNYNQVTPTGNLTYDATGDYAYTRPAHRDTYTVPRWTATQTLTADRTGRRSKRSERTGLNLAKMGEASSEPARPDPRHQLRRHGGGRAA